MCVATSFTIYCTWWGPIHFKGQGEDLHIFFYTLEFYLTWRICITVTVLAKITTVQFFPEWKQFIFKLIQKRSQYKASTAIDCSFTSKSLTFILPLSVFNSNLMMYCASLFLWRRVAIVMLLQPSNNEYWLTFFSYITSATPSPIILSAMKIILFLWKMLLIHIIRSVILFHLSVW